MIRLKPCPFCGCTMVDATEYYLDGVTFYEVFCPGCRVAVRGVDACSASETAELWNRRPK